MSLAAGEPFDAVLDAALDDAHGRTDRAGAAPHSLLWFIGCGVMFGLLGLALLVLVLIVVVPAATDGERYATVAGLAATDIPAGSLVVIHPTPAAGLATGDVVAVRADGGVATAVVSGRASSSPGGPELVLLGGAGPVPVSEVRGVVWYAIPGLGWADGLLTGPARAWALPGVGLVLFGYAGWLCLSAFLDRQRGRGRDSAAEV